VIALQIRSSIVALLILVGCGDQERDRRVTPGGGSRQGLTQAKAVDSSGVVTTGPGQSPITHNPDTRPILERIPDLDDRAALAVTGQLGCGGHAETILVTSRGVRVSKEVSDGRRVFGLNIKTAELIELLKARCLSNRTGQGPMAGRKTSLCYVILDALSHSADPDAIPVIGELLLDPEETTSSFAALALFTIGNEADELRSSIGQVRFPRKAAAGAVAGGHEIPKWLPPGAIRD
jgi:hypothetical protein